MASELWWASIGGSDCEPIRLIRDRKGLPKEWFSIGCGDPHSLEGVVLIEIIPPHTIPLTHAQQKKQERAWKREQARMPAAYRRFD